MLSLHTLAEAMLLPSSLLYYFFLPRFNSLNLIQLQPQRTELQPDTRLW
jgi:hypothetical protein